MDEEGVSFSHMYANMELQKNWINFIQSPHHTHFHNICELNPGTCGFSLFIPAFMLP